MDKTAPPKQASTAGGRVARRIPADRTFGASFSHALAVLDNEARAASADERADAAVVPAKPRPGRWAIVQRLDDPDPERANAQALEDLSHGATGLSIVFEGAPNAFGYGLPAEQAALARALQGVALNRTHLRIDVHPASRASVDWLVALMSSQRIDPSKLSLSFGIDQAAIFAGTGRLRMSIEALQASMPQSLAHFFALGVPGVLLEADGRVFHNAGASEAQELGAMIATAVMHLRMFEEARQPLVYAAPHIGFAVSVDQDEFLSIAKLRALRRMWARAQQACSITPSAAAIHAETSYRMMTAKEPVTNIARTTIAAFAAAVGGADSITVLPHTIARGLADGESRRMARSTQLVLATETHSDFLPDSEIGTSAFEEYVGKLCEAGWAEFSHIEAEGGMMKSLSAGLLQRRILAARDARTERYSAGERAIVGTTLHPPMVERAVQVLEALTRPVPKDGVTFCDMLPPMRLDASLSAVPG